MPDLPGSSSSAAGSSSRTCLLYPEDLSPSHRSQRWPGSSRSASPRRPSPAHSSHSYHHEKKGFRLWKLCV